MHEHEQLDWKRESISALITVLSLFIAGILDFPNLARPVVANVSTYHLLVALDALACTYFWLEFFAGLRRSTDRRGFALTRSLEMLGAVPVLLPLRFLRAIRLIRLLRFLRLGAITFRLWGVWGQALASRPVQALALASFALLVIGSSAFYYAEYGFNTQVHSIVDAIWLTVSSITTLGFGDLYAISTAGRIVSVVVFIISIGIFGSMTAALAGYIIREPDPAGPDLTDIVSKLERLEVMLAEMRASQQGQSA